MLEHCLYDQIYKTIDNTRPRHQMGYRKGYSSQHSLIAMFEKWKKNLDKGGECGVLFVKVRIWIFNPFITGKIEKFDFWDANNYTNFKHE